MPNKAGEKLKNASAVILFNLAGLSLGIFVIELSFGNW